MSAARRGTAVRGHGCCGARAEGDEKLQLLLAKPYLAGLRGARRGCERGDGSGRHDWPAGGRLGQTYGATDRLQQGIRGRTHGAGEDRTCSRSNLDLFVR